MHKPIPVPTRKIEGTHTLVAGYGYLTGMGPGQGKITHGLPVSHTNYIRVLELKEKQCNLKQLKIENYIEMRQN